MPGGRESWTGNLHIKSSFQPIATCEPYLDPDSESTNCEEKKKKKSYDSWKFELLIGYFVTEELVVVF